MKVRAPNVQSLVLSEIDVAIARRAVYKLTEERNDMKKTIGTEVMPLDPGLVKPLPVAAVPIGECGNAISICKYLADHDSSMWHYSIALKCVLLLGKPN